MALYKNARIISIMHGCIREGFSMKGQTIRIGVDVGGTNTDICAIDEKAES